MDNNNQRQENLRNLKLRNKRKQQELINNFKSKFHIDLIEERHPDDQNKTLLLSEQKETTKTAYSAHNHIYISIADVEVNALTDTGATCLLKDYNFFLKLKHHPTMKLDVIGGKTIKILKTIKTADGKFIKIKGSLNTNIWLSAKYFLNIEFYVIKNCPQSVMLGENFLTCFHEIILKIILL